MFDLCVTAFFMNAFEDADILFAVSVIPRFAFWKIIEPSFGSNPGGAGRTARVDGDLQAGPQRPNQ